LHALYISYKFILLKNDYVAFTLLESFKSIVLTILYNYIDILNLQEKYHFNSDTDNFIQYKISI